MPNVACKGLCLPDSEIERVTALLKPLTSLIRSRKAQLALAFQGQDRSLVLSQLVELLADRELGSPR